MTGEKKTMLIKRFLSRGSVAVAPLLLICSLSMAVYMTTGYLSVSEENNSQETEAGGSSGTSSTHSGSGTVDAAALEKQAIIGQYTAVSSSEEPGRIENIRLAAEAINGTVIEPGATLSFNEMVGDVENDERYQLAPVVSENEMVYGRGGGSCQVSSTLYLAALYTNLTIVERHAHSAVVDYVPIGLDATVVYGIMDLKILNDSEFPITILAEAEGQSVTVRLFGQPLEEGILIEPISSLIEYHVAGTPISSEVQWEPGLEDTTYYIVESYREYYYQGNKTDSKLLARNLYKVFDNSTVKMPDGNLDVSK